VSEFVDSRFGIFNERIDCFTWTVFNLDSWFVSEKLKKMNNAPYALLKGRRMMRLFLSIPCHFANLMMWQSLSGLRDGILND